MDAFQFVDIFSTKGIEYILVITFLLVFVMFWRLLNKPLSLNKNISPEMSPSIINFNAFKMAEDYYYHPGHSWLRVNDQNVVTVGLDDFAVKLMGKPDKILLPKKDQLVRQGDKALSLNISGESIEILSPVNGRVTEINEQALLNPSIVSDSPYERGWLLKIEPSNITANVKNLLKGNYAKAWLEETITGISSRYADNLGIVMQDGGSPVEGFAKELDCEKWDDVIKEYLLTD